MGLAVIAIDYHRCIHFHGIQKTCGAGVDPKSVRDESGDGPYKWPCLSLVGRPVATTSCASFRAMTAVELKAEEDAIRAAVDKFEADLRAGSCPHCSAKIDSRRRSDRCEYAMPCGHRLGQVGGDESDPT